MFGYNLLVNRIRALIVRLDNFASELKGIFDRHFVDHRSLMIEKADGADFSEPDLPIVSAAPSSAAQAVSTPALAALSRPPVMVETTSEL
jgi:biopolymer transport protein TolQ